MDSRSGSWVQRAHVDPEGALVARRRESQMAQMAMWQARINSVVACAKDALSCRPRDLDGAEVIRKLLRGPERPCTVQLWHYSRRTTTLGLKQELTWRMSEGMKETRRSGPKKLHSYVSN